jgi:hypothetical protein
MITVVKYPTEMFVRSLIQYREVNGVLVPASLDLKERPYVIRVYLDESYDDVSYGVGGLIGAEEKWTGFANDWNAAMEKHGLKGVALHMRELQGSNKEPWASLRSDPAKPVALLDDLAGVVIVHQLTPFVTVALMDEYKALDAEGTKRWPKPYKLTFETAFDALEDTCDPAPDGNGRIHVTVDRGPSEGWAKAAYIKLRAKNAPCSEHFAETLESRGHRGSPELCAADMIAWELRRAIYNHLVNGVDALRPSFQKLMNGMKVLWKVDFSKVLDPKQLVTFQGTSDPSAGAPGQIVLAIDEPLKV